MKDYYYFLGIEPTATPDDIKKSYRKLSLKYHPDKNGNDEFFANRFREILEAYDVLTDENRKKVYDKNFIKLRHQKSILPPKIVSFTSSKIRVKKGEEVVLYWQTYDADLLKLVPFGLEKPNGERRIIVTDFDEDGNFQVLLHVTNTLLQKTIVKGLVISELLEVNNDKPIAINSIKESDRSFNFQINKKVSFSFFLIVLIIVLAWLLVS